MSKKQDAYYFNNFIECAECACKAVHLLDEIMNNFNRGELSDYLNKNARIRAFCRQQKT